MSSVSLNEDKSPRTAADAYDEVGLKIERLKSITVLIRAADPGHMIEKELESVGYALEHMVDGIGEGVDELYKLGDAK